MAELPNWAWYLLVFLGAAFVLGYLRALAAAADDTLSVHRLRHEAAALQIRQFKQLKAIQLGVHPGDIFTSDERLDRMIADAEAKIAGEKADGADPNAPGNAPAEPNPAADAASDPAREGDMSTADDAGASGAEAGPPGVAGTVPGAVSEPAPARRAA